MVSNTPPVYAWMIFNPDVKKDKPGRWKGIVTGAGIGTLTVNYTVHPPTAAEREDLARYEQAREAVFRTFALKWVGITNHFGASPKEIFYYTITSGSNTNNFELLGIGGVDHTFQLYNITPADRLNGITYHGTAGITFTVLRRFYPSVGWRPWQNINDRDSPVAELFKFGGNRDSGYPIVYWFVQKDGNWTIRSDLGDVILNDRLWNPDNKTQFSRPDEAFVRMRIENADDPRRLDKTKGDEAKQRPLPSEAELQGTMMLLRGRPLD
jgi:hypothetical protein